MKDINTPQIGVIFNGEKTLNFYLDDYNVAFMNTDSSKTLLEGPFAFGETYNYQKIAIYKGENPITFSGVQRICTAAYIIAIQNALGAQWDTFDSIEFVGGTLNTLFRCSALENEHQDNRVTYVMKSDKKQYSFVVNNCPCMIEIFSSITESFGPAGNSISNNQVHFQLKFDSSQPLLDSLKYIQKVKDILAFMCFRKNVGFDEIFLYHKDKNLSKMKVFLKEDTEYTKKKHYRNISFDI